MPPDPLTSACFAHSVLDYHRHFTTHVYNLNLLFHSLCINCITTALYFAWPKLKCFCHPWLTLLLPNSPISRESSAATGLSPVEGSGGKCTYQEAQELGLGEICLKFLVLCYASNSWKWNYYASRLRCIMPHLLGYNLLGHNLLGHNLLGHNLLGHNQGPRQASVVNWIWLPAAVKILVMVN